jgi:hypothetical protein
VNYNMRRPPVEKPPPIEDKTTEPSIAVQLLKFIFWLVIAAVVGSILLLGLVIATCKIH